MLEAYFDASERESGIFCVAGFAFGHDRAKKATRDWKWLWGDTQCHMTDLNQSPPAGDFKGWSPEKAKECTEAAIPIINNRSTFGVAVSVDTAEFSKFAPKTSDPDSKNALNGLRTPYAHCCHAAMVAMAHMTGSADIAYFFEFGDKHQGESQAFMGWIASHPSVARRLYKMRSHRVLSAADCRLFETADIFAWEWAKHVERDKDGKILDANGVTRQRGSLRALLGEGLQKSAETNVTSVNRRGWHITGAPLERYYQRIGDMELLSDQPSEKALELMLASIQTEF